MIPEVMRAQHKVRYHMAVRIEQPIAGSQIVGKSSEKRKNMNYWQECFCVLLSFIHLSILPVYPDLRAWNRL